MRIDFFDKKYALTELGNAFRFRDYAKGDFAYIPKTKQWMYWDENKWKPDWSKTKVLKRAEQMVNDMKEQFENTQSLTDQESEDIEKLIKNSQKHSGINSFIKLSAPHFEQDIDNFDSDDSLIHLKNGTYNFDTQTFEPGHNQKHYNTKIANVEYDKQATYQKWLESLNQWFLGDPDLIRYVQKYCGYSISGKTEEQSVFFAYGEGRNGKSVFLNVLSKIMADYSSNTPVNTVMKKQSPGSIPNDLARLNQVRFLTCQEPDKNIVLSEAIIKYLTGNDTITARFFRQEFFEFVPKFKLWIATNYLPQIQSQQLSIWRRIKIIPFNYTVPENEINKNLENELLNEASGILNWAIEGYNSWRQEGLDDMPDTIADAIKNYKAESDSIGRFIDERLIKTPEKRILKRDLYEAYRSWAKHNFEEHIETINGFGKALKKKGFDEKKSNSKTYWVGIHLNNDKIIDVEDLSEREFQEAV